MAAVFTPGKEGKIIEEEKSLETLFGGWRKRGPRKLRDRSKAMQLGQDHSPLPGLLLFPR